MTFLKFCTKHYLSPNDAQTFRVWLGDTSKSRLPERVWIGLFKEFIYGGNGS